MLRRDASPALTRSRFLQGPGTDPNTVSQIRDAIRTNAELTVRILNYTKSGRPFWNMFTLAPMGGERRARPGHSLPGSPDPLAWSGPR